MLQPPMSMCRTARPWQVVTVIAGSKQRLLMAGDDDRMLMTRNLNVMPKTTEQHLIACSDKSVAYVIRHLYSP